MTDEITFQKYKSCGAGYHWAQNSRHPRRMNAYVKARYQKCLQLLEAQLKSLQGRRILDLGCGDGVLTYELVRRKAEAYGLDLSMEAIEFARARHQSLGSNAVFHVGSCYETSYQDASFDGVVSSDVIEHLNDPQCFLQEIKRVLKPGGVAVISTPIRFTARPLDTMHVCEWYPGEFQCLVRQVFEQSEFTDSHPVFWYELMIRSENCRLLVNLISYLRNPFLNRGCWRYPCMQYAIVTKA